ncbi:MAG TPA: hypothetical protein VEB22_13200 [Phycisphaerales bacterium]|nr:hypothetical protein [Phycisphaerales bacterium]
MSSMNGLSSNSTGSQSRNALQLDSSARNTILARNQAQVLSALGVTRKDDFSGGGGINPLKGLYSAAAATFLKNKKGQQESDSNRVRGSYEKAADILKSLEKKSESSDPGSFQNNNSKVSGPSTGAGYRKYQWSGAGVTGSDVIEEEESVEEAPAAEEPPDPADFQPVLEALEKVVLDAGGGFGDNGDGTFEFKVLDINGSIKQDGNKLLGTVVGGSGTYTFEIDADGAVVIDASKGNTASAEFDQVKRMLGGSLDGARRVEAEPAAEPEEPEEEAPASQEGSLFSAVLTTSTATLLSLTGSGKSSDRGRYNAKLLISDMQAAGGAVTAGDGSTLDVSFNGQAGRLELKDDVVRGSIGSGNSEIKFEIRSNGIVKIDGSDSNSGAKAMSLAFRKAIGASTSSGTDFEARVVKFNRNGTGSGLNLLNLLG